MSGDHKIRIFTIGMGDLVKMNLGTIPETSESVLMRVANDKKSPDYNSSAAGRASTTTRRPPPTSARCSSSCRTRSSA